MRVNVYAEEMTDRIEIIAKEIDGNSFTGLRFYLELPATVGGQQYQGPFMHHPGDDDSAAVTFWGKRDLRTVLRKALKMLDSHYNHRLIDNTLTREAGGIVARCTCGWSSGGHFSSMGASAAMQDHQEQVARHADSLSDGVSK